MPGDDIIDSLSTPSLKTLFLFSTFYEPFGVFLCKIDGVAQCYRCVIHSFVFPSAVLCLKVVFFVFGLDKPGAWDRVPIPIR
jgi:hypothetical protein